MTLNSEGLEKTWRFDIQHGPEGEASFAWVYAGKDLVATMRTHHAESVVEAMNRRALPPVDGLEVVAWDVSSKGLPADPTKSQSFVAEIEKQGGVISPLVTLSQASSVIAGLKAERDEALDKAKEVRLLLEYVEDSIAKLTSKWNFQMDRADTAEARISSLEEENKRLIALIEEKGSASLIRAALDATRSAKEGKSEDRVEKTEKT